MTRSVVIIQKHVPRYRAQFFERLRRELTTRGVKLRLVYGDPVGTDVQRRDSRNVAWGEYRRNRILRTGQRPLIWQPVLDATRDADLVIVEQANKLLVNNVLLARQYLGRAPVAFWGHGANLQSQGGAFLSEHAKRLLANLPHWWFAYTECCRQRVNSYGFPSERISVVQNAIDTEALRAECSSVTKDEIQAFRSHYNLGEGPIALFIGSLYDEKRLPFLCDAVSLARDQIPTLRLVIAGDGGGRSYLEERAAAEPWVTLTGSLVDRAKAVALATSSVFAMPGLVGLAILDAFAAGLPLVTTNVDYHSPEIEYLEDGVNGVIVRPADDVEQYARALCDVATEGRGSVLRANALASAMQFTLPAMVERFSNGVLAALAAQRRCPKVFL